MHSPRNSGTVTQVLRGALSSLLFEGVVLNLTKLLFAFVFAFALAVFPASVLAAEPPSQVVPGNDTSETAMEETANRQSLWLPEPRVFSVPKSQGDDEGGWASELRPEYRTRFIRIEPLDLAGVHATNLGWAEQRLRLDWTLARKNWAAIHVQVDVLDGVLFGDNGNFGSEPSVNSGLGITSKRPNHAGWTVGNRDGGDPFDVDSYVPRLTGIEPININYAYGEVLLPFGVLRIGRQPIGDVGSVSINDGRTGRNLWGSSWYHQAADRVLFGTKISELFAIIADDDHVVDSSLERGVMMGFVYDYLTQDEIFRTTDDLQQVAAQLDWRVPATKVLGLEIERFRLTGTVSYRWEERYNTGIMGLPIRLYLDMPKFRLAADVTFVEGSTQELSVGFSELVGRDVVDQEISGLGARVSVEGDLGPVTLRAEWAYASGDEDPRPETPLTLFSWPRDTNLGLMLFEHALAFQSARSAAVGIENLKQLQSESFPLTEISTEGRVTNVNAVFPQIFYRPIPSLQLKFGALFAWSAAPTVDPIMSNLNFDGEKIEDDLVNYNGGKPGNYWGTEIDLGVEYRYKDVFSAVVEGAILMPGDGLRDENGDAVTGWMLETRLRLNL